MREIDDERLLGILYDLATALGRLHGRLLGELSELDAIGGNSADNLLRKEERFIEALRQNRHDPLSLSLLDELLRATSERVLESFDVINGRPRPPHGPAS